MKPIHTTLAFGLLLATARVPAQTIAVLEGSVPTAMALRLFDETRPSSSGKLLLDRLEMLPIEMTNRTTQMAFVPGRTRLREQQGLRFLELPGGGKLFHYRQHGSTARYGFLLIQGNGGAVLIHDLPGIGASFQDNPYTDRIGVAPDGRHACLTTPAGGLWVARLDGQNFASTGKPVRLLQLPAKVLVEPIGVVVGRTHLFVVTGDDRVRRTALADGNQLQDLTPSSPLGSKMKDGMAPSGTGDEVVFLLGPPKLFSLFLLRSTGAAVKLPPKPAQYEEPGYLPEVQGGPRLLLNQDASRLMYIDASLRDEIFLMDVAGSTGTTHVTSDANFQPYIGVGIFPSFAAQSLTLAVGDIGAFDWFQSTTASRTVVNVTQTGGRTTPPFTAGTLKPVSAALAPDGALLTVEQLANQQLRTRRIDPVTNKSTFLVDALRGAPEMGSSLGGQHSVLLPGHGGDMLLGGRPASSALSGPPGVHLSTEVMDAAARFGVFTARDATSGFTLPIVRVFGGSLLLGPVHAGLRQVCMTAGGGVLLNGRTLLYAAPGVQVTVPSSAVLRIVLSGASN